MQIHEEERDRERVKRKKRKCYDLIENERVWNNRRVTREIKCWRGVQLHEEEIEQREKC